MAPRDFTEDGAAGAGMQAGDSYPSAISMSDPGPAPPQPAAQSPSGGGGVAMGYNPGGGGGLTPPTPPKPKTPSDYPVGSPEWQSQFIQDTTGITHPEFLQNTGGFQRIASFSEGGAIDDTDGSPQQDAISQALSTIDGVLAFGRRLHGLGGGDNEGAIKMAGPMPTRPGGQSETGIPPAAPGPGTLPPTSNPFGKRMAANMPTRPAGQSETGIPPAAPGPGTLPPTSNPFGKRADDDSGPAIDTDEETA